MTMVATQWPMVVNVSEVWEEAVVAAEVAWEEVLVEDEWVAAGTRSKFMCKHFANDPNQSFQLLIIYAEVINMFLKRLSFGSKEFIKEL